MSKTLVFMRTHIISKGVISEFLKLKNSTDYDCILFIDNHKKIIPGDFNEPVQNLDFFDGLGKDIKCFLFDENIFKTFNLPYYASKNTNTSISNVMWYCADYIFYIIKRYFPNYDYYWHFDYDVFCNGDSYKPFFSKYENDNADLIVSGLSALNKNSGWEWLKKTDWAYLGKTCYSSFFPVVRLSSRAIDFMYQRRLEMSALFFGISKNKANRWMNCELFAPTELLNNGFKGTRLEENLRFAPNYDLNEDRLFEHPDNKIYHPVKGNYEAALESLQNRVKTLEKYKISLFGYHIGLFIGKKRK